MPQPYSNVIAYSHTATDNLQFRLIQTDLWIGEANIHIVTNNAVYGKVNLQPATANAGDILTFQNFNLADLWFANAGAGSNTSIFIVGITMSKPKMVELGL